MRGSDSAEFGGKRRPKDVGPILVLDGDMVASLAVVRGLGSRGYRVVVASASMRPIAAFSDYCRGSLTYPDPLSDETGFLDWIRTHANLERYRLIIPVTERTLVPLSRNRRVLAEVSVAMAGEESLELALDKSRTLKLASQLGINIPAGHKVSTLDDLKSIDSLLSWPVVIKPVRSVGHDGANYQKYAVSYAADADDLRTKLRGTLERTQVVLQEYFEGRGVGVELIAKDGEILYAFQHERLHEVPLTGGGSSFRKSVEISPALLEATVTLIRALKWHGVAMVEFKWQPESANYRLMEVNGRLWGSLPLAVAAGANFPAMIAELAFTGNISQWAPYRRGVYCRKLSRDVVWFEEVLRSKPSDTVTVPGLARVLMDALLIFSPKHCFDVQSFKDPWPGVIDVYRLARSYFKRFLSLVSEKRFTILQRIAWRNGAIRERLRSAESVLIICYGNINRSAIAEILIKRKFGAQFRLVQSAGFHAEAGRPMDPGMAAVATNHGVDVPESISSVVDRPMISDSDIIFVMEKRHYDALLDIDPEARGKIFLLGVCAENGARFHAEIADPYGRPDAAYEKCFQNIERAVSSLAVSVAQAHTPLTTLR